MKRCFAYRIYFEPDGYYALGAANVGEAIQTAREFAERLHSLPPGSQPIKVERIDGLLMIRELKRLPRLKVPKGRFGI